MNINNTDLEMNVNTLDTAQGLPVHTQAAKSDSCVYLTRKLVNLNHQVRSVATATSNQGSQCIEGCMNCSPTWAPIIIGALISGTCIISVMGGIGCFDNPQATCRTLASVVKLDTQTTGIILLLGPVVIATGTAVVFKLPQKIRTLFA